MQTEQANLNKQKRSKFWLFQFLGWSPYFIFQLILFGSDNWLGNDSLVYGISSTAIAIGGSLLLHSIFKKVTDKNLSAGKWLAIVMIACLLLSAAVDIVHQGILISMSKVIADFALIHEQQPLFAKSFILFFVYLFWSGFYLILTRQEKLNNAFLHQKSTELLLKEAQLTKLLEQLNPHFMFNTINNIRALILRDSEMARDMLTRFSDIMRYQMNITDTPLVQLRDELAFVHDFIELARLQIGKRLIFSEVIDESLLVKQIPRMSLQLLVENALKHGLNKTTSPGRLIITIAEQKNKWFVKVSNDGKLTNGQSDSGVGLKNLKQRLQLSFEDNFEFSLEQNGDMVESSMIFIQAKDQ